MQVILLPFHLYFYFILIFGPCFLKTDSSPHFFLVIFTLVSFWNYDKRTWVHAVRRVTAETPENAKHSTWARTQVRKKSHVKRTHHQSLVGPYAFPFTPSYCCCPLAQQWSWTRWRGFVAPCRPIEKEARSLHSSQRWVECDDSLWVMAVSNKFVIFFFKLGAYAASCPGLECKVNHSQVFFLHHVGRSSCLKCQTTRFLQGNHPKLCTLK